MDCVHGKSLKVFTGHYQNWCKRKGYNFSEEKVAQIYCISSALIVFLPKNANAKILVRQAVTLLANSFTTLEHLRMHLNKIVTSFSEYPAIIAIDMLACLWNFSLWLRLKMFLSILIAVHLLLSQASSSGK